MKDPLKNYQAFKKHYYQNIMNVDSILKNDDFIAKLNKFLSLEDQKNPGFSSENDEISSDFVKNKDIISILLENLNEMVEKNESNFKKILQAIMGIRAQYRRMRKLKDEKDIIKDDPNIKVLFLEIEEKLYNIGMIKLEEIKNSSHFKAFFFS